MHWTKTCFSILLSKICLSLLLKREEEKAKEDILPCFSALNKNPLLAGLNEKIEKNEELKANLLGKKRVDETKKEEKKVRNKESARKCREKKKALLDAKETDIKKKKEFISTYSAENKLDLASLDAYKSADELLLLILKETAVVKSQVESVDDCLSCLKQQ